MSDLKSKRAPVTESNQRAWAQVYDDINDIIKAVNNKSGVESRDGASGKDGDIRLFKDVDRTKYFIEGKFGDGWAKRELIFSDTSDAGQDESINFSATESYVKPDGSVSFTGKVIGVSPAGGNTNHLATKGYVDDNATAFELTGNVTGGTSGATTVATTIATNAIAQAMMQDNSVGTAEILNSNVTYAKIQNVSATDRVLGRNSSGAGVVEEITPTQLAAIVAEAQSAGNDQDMFLAGTGVFREPSMGVNIAGISDTVITSVADNHFLYYDYNSVSDTGFWKNRLLVASDIPTIDISSGTTGTLPVNRGGTGATSGYNSSNWNTAYTWGDHGAAGYMSGWKIREFDGTDNDVNNGEIVRFTSNNGGSHGYGSITGSGTTSDPFIVSLNTPNTTYTAGNSNITISGNQISSVNTNQLTSFYMRDDDNDAVYLHNDHYVTFATSGGVTTNWSATDAAGSSGDPHILTIGFDQSSITTVGTITNGTWNAGVIPSSKLDADTAHLSGTQTFSGAKTFSSAATMLGLQINGGNSSDASGQDATLYVSATSDNDWGIFLNKPSNEYGLRVDINGSASHAFRILNNAGTQKFNITGTGKTSIDTTTATYGLNVGTSGAGFWGQLYMFSQGLYSYNGSSYLKFFNNSNIGELLMSDTSGANYKGLTIQTGGTGNDAGRISTTGRLYVGGVETITAEPSWSTGSTAMFQVKGFARVEDYIIINSSADRTNSVGWKYDGGIRTFKEGSGSENVYAGADVVAYYSSDPRLKKNKKVISKPFAKLRKLNGYTFDWKKSAKKLGNHLEGKDYGVMADEVESVMPELVERRDNGYRAVKYEKIIPLLIECIKEQQKDITRLKRTRNKWI